MTWSFSKKIIFRFGFLFFVLFIFYKPNPNVFFPYVDDVYAIYIQPFHQLIPWIGKHLLQLPYEITVFPNNGSSDTTYDYVMLLFIFSLAFWGCIVWTVIDKKRSSYHTLYYWLTVLVRYYVALNMFNYGLTKIFMLQFEAPSPFVLLEPYGSSSPMGLAWTFFGYSVGYNYFIGLGEIISGGLLLFRHTKRAGALLTLVVAGNIMAINYSFDVCVKLLSTGLVVMCLFLLLQQRKQHAAFFFLNRPVEPDSMPAPEFRRKWFKISLVALKYAALVFVLYYSFSFLTRYSKEFGPDAAKPPLYGIYDVHTFVKNKDTLAPLTTDTVRWRKLIVSWAGSSTIKLMNDSIKGYVFKPDTLTRRIVMHSKTDTTKKLDLVYSFMGQDTLLLQGGMG